MSKRVFALFDRDQECEHGLGFAYTGTIPCTGPKRCPLCGSYLLDDGTIMEAHDEPDLQ